MKEFDSPEELKRFLLNGAGDLDDDLRSSPDVCFSLSWKKDSWIVRANNKRIGIITKENIPENIDMKDENLLFGMLGVLRDSVKLAEANPEVTVDPLEMLNNYLAGLHEKTIG